MMQASAKKTTTTTTTTTATRISSAISSSTTLTESITTIDNVEKTASISEHDEQDGELEEQDDDGTEPTSRDAEVQTDYVKTVLEKREVVASESSVEQQLEGKFDDSGEDSVVPILEGSPRRPTVRKEVMKPVAKDTTVNVAEEEDEDNIHPLARTVVKSTSRPLHRKPHADTSNHDSTDKAHQPVNIPSKSPRKIVVREPVMSETVLPLPSHMDAMFELFKGLEQVLEFTKRQGQLCFYHKLRKHVELQSGR